MIEKKIILNEYQGDKIVELLEIMPAYEYKANQMMVPCKVVKEFKGQQNEMYSGVIVYLREHDGQKSAVVTGYFTRLTDNQVNNTQ